MTIEMASKLTTMQQAVSTMQEGQNLTFGGFAHSLAPLAFVREMIRQGKKGFDLTSMGECWAVDLLSGVGAIRRARLSNYMFEGYGRCMNFSRAVESGEMQVEDYSHFGITSRFLAGALGVPFLPLRSMAGTDIERIRSFDSNKMARVNSPFNGEEVVAVEAVQPDVAIVHVSRCDQQGNCQIFGMTSTIDEQVRSAKRVIVTAEEIVDSEVIRKQPELTIIPGFLVDAVVEAPYGAHPAGMYRYYDYDPEHIRCYWELSRTAEGFGRYLDEFVYGTRNHWDYLERIGLRRLFELRADPYLGYAWR